MQVSQANLNLNFDANSLQRGKRYFSQGRVQNLVRETEGTVEERIQALQARKSQLADGLYGKADTFSSAITADDISVLFEK